jgi:hypothetical protein
VESAGVKDLTSFDLRTQSETAARAVRGFRLFLGVCAGLLAALTAAIALFNLARHAFVQNISATYGAEYVGFGIVIGVFLATVWLSRPGIVGLDISPSELRLTWPSGKQESLSWTSPRLRVNLFDYSIDPLVANPNYRDLRLPFRPKSVITPEAFDAILAAARSKQCSIRPWTPSVAWRGKCSATEIRAPNAGP